MEESTAVVESKGKGRFRSGSVVGCLNTAVYKNIKLVYKNIKLGTLSAPMHMHADTHIQHPCFWY